MKSLRIVAALGLFMAFAVPGVAQKSTSKTLLPGEKLSTSQQGVRSNVYYNPQIEAFTGVVQNTSEKAINGLRSEIDVMTPTGVVHLGPSAVINLKPGEKKEFTFGTDGMVFESWRLVVVRGER